MNEPYVHRHRCIPYMWSCHLDHEEIILLTFYSLDEVFCISNQYLKNAKNVMYTSL